MVFSVKYRKSDGTLDTLEVEAASRAAVFPLLEKRGIKAIKVDDGPAKRGGWNHPQRAKSAARSSRPSPFRGLIAGLIVCILAIGAYFAFFSGSEKPQEKNETKKPKVIKEVKPAAAPTNAAPVKKVLTKEEKRLADIKYFRDKYGDNLPENIKSTVYYLEHPPKQIIHHESPFSYLRHPCERQIASFLSAEPGALYIQKPTFDSRFDRDFQNAFVDKIDILDTDSDEVKQMKLNVEAVKKELAETCRKESRLPSEIMSEHAANMYELGRFKDELQREIARYSDDAANTDEDVELYYKAANKMLKDRGIGEIAMPSLVRRNARLKILERRNERRKSATAGAEGESKKGE